MNTEKKKRPTIASYEWASVCQYMVWVSARMGLSDVSADAVHSFPLAKLGFDKLERRKLKAQSLLQENIQKIETYVGRNKGELGPPEMDVIRGMWRSTVNAKSAVDEQLVRIKALRQVVEEQTSWLGLGDDDDDLPF